VPPIFRRDIVSPAAVSPLRLMAAWRRLPAACSSAFAAPPECDTPAVAIFTAMILLPLIAPIFVTDFRRLMIFSVFD